MTETQVRTRHVMDALARMRTNPRVWMQHPQPVYQDGCLLISLDLCEEIKTAGPDDPALDFYGLDGIGGVTAYTPENVMEILVETLKLLGLSTHPPALMRVGGENLVPSNPHRRVLYTGPARSEIMEVPLTESLLEERIGLLRSGSDAYWSSRTEDRVVCAGDGFSVSVFFQKGIALSTRYEVERSIMDGFSGDGFPVSHVGASNWNN
ncbi:hypothetical protein [Rhodococcus qingshengii]|uniref:hypothetical protein n=1 Tax=Rhodococcus qingshengii TaxID=334542 RepID=UPI0035DD59F8